MLLFHHYCICNSLLESIGNWILYSHTEGSISLRVKCEETDCGLNKTYFNGRAIMNCITQGWIQGFDLNNIVRASVYVESLYIPISQIQ